MDLAQFAERSLSLRIEFAAWQLIAFITGQPYQGFVNPYPLSNPTTIIQPTKAPNLTKTRHPYVSADILIPFSEFNQLFFLSGLTWYFSYG